MCRACTTFLASASATIREILVLEAPWLIIFTFTSSRPKTLKTCITIFKCLTSPDEHMLHGATCYGNISQPFTCCAMLQ